MRTSFYPRQTQGVIYRLARKVNQALDNHEHILDIREKRSRGASRLRRRRKYWANVQKKWDKRIDTLIPSDK